MIEFYKLTNLSAYKLLKKFPAGIRDTIRSNITPQSGDYFATCALEGNRAVAAGGIRRNEDGCWMAWFWKDRGELRSIAILREVQRELERYQGAVEGPVHAIVSRFNPQGKRLAVWLGFRAVGDYTDLEDPAKSIYVFKRDYHGSECDAGGGVTNLSGIVG